jgi:hypothetical protein
MAKRSRPRSNRANAILLSGAIVVMDNLPAHKRPAVCAAIEAASAKLTPPRSTPSPRRAAPTTSPQPAKVQLDRNLREEPVMPARVSTIR